jgi:hypothetical protein
MAVGDIINEIVLTTSFVPAAGVEILILKVFRSNSFNVRVGFSDGVNHPNAYLDTAASVANRMADVTRYGITNTDYFYMSSSGTEFGFSGIQIK